MRKNICENTDVVLFNSPIYRERCSNAETYLPPLGQGYIITSLRQHGINADLVDCVYDRLSVTKTISIINQGTFPNIGFNIFSVNMMLVKDILLGIKRNVRIFLGGKAIGHLWQEILDWNIAYPMTFIVGEGELIFPALVRQECKENPIFDNGFHKVYEVNKTSNYYPFNLNEIAINRALFEGREILNRYGRFEACIVASRGCIYNCAFCGGAVSANPNNIARTREYDSLFCEISDILRISPKVSSIRVLDDLFLRDRKSILDACLLFSSFPQLHWRCMAHVNTFKKNLDLVRYLKDSGCDEVFIGIESGSFDVRSCIHKLGTPKDIIDVIHGLTAEGVNVKGYFICGFPDETKEQLQETLDLAKKLHSITEGSSGAFRSTVFKFRPYHGTELYKKVFSTKPDVCYSMPDQLTSSHQQYNFSAGNFSKVSDDVLEWYIYQIDQLNER